MIWVCILVGYVSGSVPFGLLIGFAFGRDIRTTGSGNIGATNALRVCGWKAGVPALALDIGKGVLPVLLATHVLAPETAGASVLAGMAAILGHNFPVWLRFKGGKGVATSAGVVAALMPKEFAVAIGVFLVIVFLTRYVSLSSMIAAMAMVAARFALTETPFGADAWAKTVAALALGLMVLVRHQANIRRLLAGTESKVGQKKTEGVAPDETTTTPDRGGETTHA